VRRRGVSEIPERQTEAGEAAAEVLGLELRGLGPIERLADEIGEEADDMVGSRRDAHRCFERALEGGQDTRHRKIRAGRCDMAQRRGLKVADRRILGRIGDLQDEGSPVSGGHAEIPVALARQELRTTIDPEDTRDQRGRLVLVDQRSRGIHDGGVGGRSRHRLS
jgi:hypothetical protein